MKIHLVGIGGIGMSALARYFKAKGWIVSGSDLTRSEMSDTLKKEGIKITIGHTKNAIPKGADLVVFNRAIPANNPEVVVARKKRIPTLPYAEALGMVTKTYVTIAITGSHGKSTTTALAGLTLMGAGLDPTILIGTKLKELDGKNLRIGKGPYLVLEADDFGSAFLAYSPVIAIVTNIDKEHLDHYGGLPQLKKAFLQFLSNTRPGGVLILNRDDKNLFSLRAQINTLAKKNHLRVSWYSLHDPTAKKIKKTMKIPGEHNVSNALAVHRLAQVLAIPEKKTLSALGSYEGAWRRMERRGEYQGAVVYDDYAHHPTEIKATLKGFREKFSHAKLVCVFQPHQAKRLAGLFPEFITAFDEADILMLLPLYKVPGRDEMVFKNRDSKALARAIQKRFPKKMVLYLNDPKNLKAIIAPLVPKGSVLVMMGAGDIVNHTSSLLS